MHDLTSCFVLAYHGCSWDVAKRLLLRQEQFLRSENSWDWLGHGVYFWVENPRRACLWAHRHIQKRAPGQWPAVVGAVIDLRNCLDLTTRAGVEVLQMGYEVLRAACEREGRSLPRNTPAHYGDRDRLIRRLDCAVINTACEILERDGQPVDTVKGMFVEGAPAYEGSSIMEHTHTQICVRNLDCIRGIFLPPRRVFDEDCLCNEQARI